MNLQRETVGLECRPKEVGAGRPGWSLGSGSSAPARVGSDTSGHAEEGSRS